MISFFKNIFSFLLVFLPSFLKVPLYRLFFRYKIGKDVHIGFTIFNKVSQCQIDDHVDIGHFNFFSRIPKLEISKHTKIGYLNVFRGGKRVSIGSYSTILRQNIINSILEQDSVNPSDPVFELGAGSVITTGHWLDFTNHIFIGADSVIGGCGSSFWTHNRQRTKSIKIGCHCYLGSGIQIAPGVEVPPFCIVALGSVLIGKFDQPRSLIGGNPAVVIHPLHEQDLFLVIGKTRKDIPDEIALADLSEELRLAYRHVTT